MKSLLFVIFLLIVFAIVGAIELMPEERPIREQVQEYIEHCGIVQTDIVLKQAVLETGNFKIKARHGRNALRAGEQAHFVDTEITQNLSADAVQ